jgi:hypothetical protein
MLLEHQKIFRQAFLLIIRHKFLWAFGLLLFWGNTLSVFFNLPKNQQAEESANQWVAAHSGSLGWIALGVLVVFTTLVVLYFRAKAGNIIAVKALMDKQPTSFAKAFRAGQLFYWRMFGAAVLLWLVQVVAIIITIVPMSLVSASESSWQSWVMLLLGLSFLIPVLSVAILVGIFAPLFIVVYDLNVKESIQAGFNLISKDWRQIIVLFLALVILNILAFFLAVTVSLPFVFLAIFAYYRMETAGIILAAISGLMGVVVYASVQAAASVFSQIVWVLVFGELVRPQKTEEAVSLAPEVAS